MSLTEEEKKRLQKFKARTQSNRNMGNLLNTEKIDEALEFYKDKLKKIYKNATKQEIEKTIEKIEKLLAQKTGIILKEQQTQFGKIPESIIEEEIENFTKSYQQLFLLKKKLLANYG